MDEKFSQDVFELSMNAAMSTDYYKIMEWIWWLLALGENLLVACLMFLGICAAANKPKDFGKRGFSIAIWSGAVATLLLLIPMGQWSQENRELAHEWADVRHLTDKLGDDLAAAKDVPAPGMRTDYKTITERRSMIREPKEWRLILKYCQANQMERIYGAGIRTKEQVDAIKSGNPLPVDNGFYATLVAGIAIGVVLAILVKSSVGIWRRYRKPTQLSTA